MATKYSLVCSQTAIEVTTAKTILGRNNLPPTLAGNCISRRQCVIWVEDGSLHVKQLGVNASAIHRKRGTMVVLPSGKEATMILGDRLCLLEQMKEDDPLALCFTSDEEQKRDAVPVKSINRKESALSLESQPSVVWDVSKRKKQSLTNSPDISGEVLSGPASDNRSQMDIADANQEEAPASEIKSEIKSEVQHQSNDVVNDQEDSQNSDSDESSNDVHSGSLVFDDTNIKSLEPSAYIDEDSEMNPPSQPVEPRRSPRKRKPPKTYVPAPTRQKKRNRTPQKPQTKSIPNRYKAVILEFLSVTNTEDVAEAKGFLQAEKWDLQLALDSFYRSGIDSESVEESESEDSSSEKVAEDIIPNVEQQNDNNGESDTNSKPDALEGESLGDVQIDNIDNDTGVDDVEEVNGSGNDEAELKGPDNDDSEEHDQQSNNKQSEDSFSHGLSKHEKFLNELKESTIDEPLAQAKAESAMWKKKYEEMKIKYDLSKQRISMLQRQLDTTTASESPKKRKSQSYPYDSPPEKRSRRMPLLADPFDSDSD